MSSKPCLETLPCHFLPTPSAGHCLDTPGIHGRRTEQAKAKFDPRVGPRVDPRVRLRERPRHPSRLLICPVFSPSRSPHKSSHETSHEGVHRSAHESVQSSGRGSLVLFSEDSFHLFCFSANQGTKKPTNILLIGRDEGGWEKRGPGSWHPAGRLGGAV